MCSQTEIELMQTNAIFFFFKYDFSVCHSERAAVSDHTAFLGTL